MLGFLQTAEPAPIAPSMSYRKEFDGHFETVGRRIDAVNNILLVRNVRNCKWVTRHWTAVRQRLVSKMNWMLECRLAHLRETSKFLPYKIRRDWFEPHYALDEATGWFYQMLNTINNSIVDPDEGVFAVDLKATQRLKKAYESVRKVKIERAKPKK